jgi:hypothetical protein
VKSQTPTRNFESRRHFIGGSDARIIMSPDEPALTRLWKENRGEAEPEDLLGNLIVHRGAQSDLAVPFRFDSPDFVESGSRKRTPFSSINSTRALLNTLSINARDSWVPAYRPTSMFVMVFLCRPVASARSRTLQFSAARAILTCALVTGT